MISFAKIKIGDILTLTNKKSFRIFYIANNLFDKNILFAGSVGHDNIPYITFHIKVNSIF